jgi:hypothetical protein
MVRLLFFTILLTTLNGEEMPIFAKAGQCFTKSFFPPKYTKNIRTTSTKKILLRKENIKYKVIPAKYKWITKKIKISDGREKIVVTPAIYKTIYEKILIESSEKVWRESLTPNSSKVFNSCIESASNSGMDIIGTEIGTCFYEHYKPKKYIDITEKILTAEASRKIITTPAKYRTYTTKIEIDSTSQKLVPIVAKYKKVKEKVVVAPATSEWRKTTCQDRGCNQSEVVCLIEVPKKYKTITKKMLLKPSVAQKIKISPIYKEVEIEELVEPAKTKELQIHAKYGTINRRKKIEDDRFFWSDKSAKNAPSRIRTQCDKICLTQTSPKYKTIAKQIVSKPSSSRKIKTPDRYKIVRVKKVIKPASFKEIVIPAEYEMITVERERTKGFAKWMPIVCESNLTPTTVKKVQEALKKAGFYHGKIDGVWSLEAKSATRNYQRANGLTITRLSIETMKSLKIY